MHATTQAASNLLFRHLIVIVFEHSQTMGAAPGLIPLGTGSNSCVYWQVDWTDKIDAGQLADIAKLAFGKRPSAQAVAKHLATEAAKPSGGRVNEHVDAGGVAAPKRNRTELERQVEEYAALLGAISCDSYRCIF